MPPATPAPPDPESRRPSGAGVLPAGSRIGRFEVQALLGRGGMGAVYLAWDPVLERRVALKAIHLGEDGKAMAKARFRREAKALAQLNHRNVCQVHDWVETDGSAYIAMEFIEGKTLAELAKGLDLRRKLLILRAIAYALEAAHAKGIIHRDLKPSNVMVDADGQVKVLDFGLARLVDSTSAEGEDPTGNALNLTGLNHPQDGGPTLAAVPGPTREERTSVGAAPPSPSPSDWGEMTEAGVFMGSPTYASPEQMRGKRAGPPSDVFSLGVVAWELLLGDHPFPGEGRERMVATIQGDLRPLRGRGLPRWLGALLRTMLLREAAKRPTSRQVADAIGRHLAGNPAARWAAGLAIGLAVVAGGGYYLFGRSIIGDLGRGRPPRMAVMPIRNATGDPAFDAQVGVGMTELLSTALRGSPHMDVVEPESVARVLSTLRISASEALDPASQPRIANALGAQLFLRGTLGRDPAGQVNVLTYELVDGSGRIRFSGAARAPRQGSFAPYELVDPAANDLLRKVDPLRASTIQNTPVPPQAFAAYAQGKALFLKGDFKGSEPYLQDAAMKAPAFSSAVSAYAACLRRLGRDQAPAVANWALMSAKATGDRWAEGRTLGLKAYLAKDLGQLDESEKLREATLALAQAIGDRDGEIIAYNHLGLIAAERGKSKAARDFYERSLQLSQETGDKVYQSLAQNNLANLALKQGDLGTAEALYQSNLNLQQGLRNRWGEALAQNNLGVVALMARDLPAAEARLTAALATRESVGDRVGRITCLRNLGILAQMKGDLPGSAGFHRRALDLAETSGLRTIEAECRFYAAELDRLQQRFGPALAGYRQVLELLPEGVTPDVRANAQAAAAECLVRKPRPDLKEAGKWLLAIPAGSADSPYVHRAKAWLAARSGQREAALAELVRATEDPSRQAPEIRAELEAARTTFLAEAR
ncbi:serine/threonine-protein kinase [Geothrix terrae]|uniref:serine/threonine-protein kinase n=1 Tax=Geothrix terrae TaxID=2922720 RepID=UPI001FACFB81|nr:serine/threonine-protein kinase [Geothrix terrae]